MQSRECTRSQYSKTHTLCDILLKTISSLVPHICKHSFLTPNITWLGRTPVIRDQLTWSKWSYNASVYITQINKKHKLQCHMEVWIKTIEYWEWERERGREWERETELSSYLSAISNHWYTVLVILSQSLAGLLANSSSAAPWWPGSS